MTDPETESPKRWVSRSQASALLESDLSQSQSPRPSQASSRQVRGSKQETASLEEFTFPLSDHDHTRHC